MTSRGVGAANADLDDLAAAVDACLGVPLSTLSDDELSERLARLPGLTAKLDALRVQAVAAGKVRDIGHLSDQRNVANHVAAVSNADPATVRFDQRIADWLIDMGPEGGGAGGQIVAVGTPEDVAQCETSHTGQWLREVLQ